MADANEPVLLVNPGGVVVAVTAEHAATLLETDEGWEKAPKNAKEGDTPNGVNPVEAPAGNDLVPAGSSEEEAKAVADAQGTPENAQAQAAADPTNADVVTPPADDTDGETNTAADQAPEGGDSNPPANEPADDGKKAGRFFGRKK